MADVDQDQKTEHPTGKRIGEARNRGEVITSQEVNNWFILAAITILIAFFAADFASSMGKRLTKFLAMPHDIALDVLTVRELFGEIAFGFLLSFAGPAAVLVIAAVAASLTQHPFIISWEKIEPKLNRFNPVTGLKEKFKARILVEFMRDAAKLVIIAPALILVIWQHRGRLLELPSADIAAVLPLLRELVLQILAVVLVIMAVVALADYLYQRYEYFKRLRMTKQEVKDEKRQTEGDPEIKRKLYQIRVQRLRARMIQAVPKADVVITNPTHFAVALQYDQAIMAAPKVLAKGHDALAVRIRSVAEEHDVPIVENPPLARALYEAAEVDQEIPVTYYKAVAEVIGYVMRLEGGLRSERRRADRWSAGDPELAADHG